MRLRIRDYYVLHRGPILATGLCLIAAVVIWFSRPSPGDGMHVPQPQPEGSRSPLMFEGPTPGPDGEP